MSSDPFDVSFDYNDDAYTQLDKEANQDNRIGDHIFLVSEVSRETWPSGDPRLKVKGSLLTAGNALADWTFSPPPPPDVVAAEKHHWEQAKKRGINQAVNNLKQLAEYYGITPGKIKQGDEFKVKTVKTRIDPVTGQGGFIRVAAFLARDHKVSLNGSASSGAPF